MDRLLDHCIYTTDDIICFNKSYNNTGFCELHNVDSDLEKMIELYIDYTKQILGKKLDDINNASPYRCVKIYNIHELFKFLLKRKLFIFINKKLLEIIFDKITTFIKDYHEVDMVLKLKKTKQMLFGDIKNVSNIKTYDIDELIQYIRVKNTQTDNSKNVNHITIEI